MGEWLREWIVERRRGGCNRRDDGGEMVEGYMDGKEEERVGYTEG